MAKHHERIIAPCLNIRTFAISIHMGLGNASLDYEIAEIAATVPGEICVGQRHGNRFVEAAAARASAASSCAPM
jgi:hypothetical protein